MLSVARIRNPDYYLDLAAGDYYLKGGEPLGEWAGRGAASLGLRGRVKRKPFRRLLSGFAPRGKKRALVSNANSPRRRPGFDLTFTVPKSVSILWSLAPFGIRRRIQAAHRQAVLDALDIFEKEMTTVRRGRQGREQVAATIVAALFEHGTSRLDDPNLHTHAVLMNLGITPDHVGALDGRRLYHAKLTLGGLYRVALAFHMRRLLAIRLRGVKSWFEVVGVPQKLIDVFSKRSQEMKEAQRASGFQGPRSADIANLNTRKKKRHTARAKLFPRWRTEAQTHGSEAEQLVAKCIDAHSQAAASVERTAAELLSIAKDAIAEQVTELEDQESHFSKNELLRRLVPWAIKKGIAATELVQAVNAWIEQGDLVVRVGTFDHEEQFATTATLNEELELLSLVDSLAAMKTKSIATGRMAQVISRHDLNEEQYEATRKLLLGKGRIKVLAGEPGTGKTRSLAACREVWEKAGYKVIGSAVAGRAAENLHRKSEIEALTLYRMTRAIERTRLDEVKHHAKQIAKSALNILGIQGLNLPIYRLDRLKLDNKTVVVVDEASMIDTRSFLRLLRQVEQHEATLVLVGDINQLPPIEVGAPLAAIQERVETAHLTQIQRMRNEADIEALRHLAGGNAQAALESYRQRNRLHVAETANDALKELVQRWTEQGGPEDPVRHMVLVATNQERHQLNDACQDARKAAGQLGRRYISENGERFHVGERLMFLRNHMGLTSPTLIGSKRKAIYNGELGTVKSLSILERSLTVELDRGGQVIVPLCRYDHITRGYAATTHKFQGSDLEHTYVYMDPQRLSCEMAYTQLSRHKESCHIFVDQASAGQDLGTLKARLASHDRGPLAVELLARDHAERSTSLEPKSDANGRFKDFRINPSKQTHQELRERNEQKLKALEELVDGYARQRKSRRDKFKDGGGLRQLIEELRVEQKMEIGIRHANSP